MIQPERIQLLSKKPQQQGKYVLYWMQQAQRSDYNHALEYAVQKANENGLPLLVFFGLTADYPEANLRHYAFMLQGLKEVVRTLYRRGIQCIIRTVSPEKGAIELSKQAALVVTDRGYLKIQRGWRKAVAERITCPLIQVESDVIVPIEHVSQKQEYSAATLRPKLKKQLHTYLVPLARRQVNIDSLSLKVQPSLKIEKACNLLRQLPINREADPVQQLEGGSSHAEYLLNEFIEKKLKIYAEFKNNPAEDAQSRLSPYLHFGQISPLAIALAVYNTDYEGTDVFLDELIIRRELSMNFVYYNSSYDSFNCLPAWAKATLGDHITDKRDHVYSLQELEKAKTHDPYWNAAQSEMVATGSIHGYMRMYWAKKVLEWSRNPEASFNQLVYLNNKYSLDGRDANSFAGIAWCFGLHDRPWKERAIFGKIRYMSSAGLERKFPMTEYVRQVEQKISAQSSPKRTP
ncbi:MAG: deoxyribodipyrimidine photo-lyase [Spirochaetales bacterium]|nr:deoxyribodipyrimidine photo-lyase [Spirochaetales bacterium]